MKRKDFGYGKGDGGGAGRFGGLVRKADLGRCRDPFRLTQLEGYLVLEHSRQDRLLEVVGTEAGQIYVRMLGEVLLVDEGSSVLLNRDLGSGICSWSVLGDNIL